MADLSFAQALNEAKQVIVQQATRIKTDAEKIKVQQDMLSSQSQTISEQEKRATELSGDVARQSSEIQVLSQRLSEAVTAKEHSEAVIDRQGERITSQQSTISENERKIAEQSEKIHELEREREGLMEKLPTQEDTEALAAMSALLMKKTAGAVKSAPHQMRLADAA